MAHRWTRRDFLKAGSAFAATAVAGERLLAATPPATRTLLAPAMPLRALGRTGQQVSLFTLGGRGALARPDNQATATAVINRALELGVNCIDTGVSYGSGASQRYIGQALGARRAQVFLASKTNDRTSEGCCRALDDALVALHTDRVDLWQIENVTTMREVDQITSPGGALEGFQYAKEMRQARFLGITGLSNPAVLMELLRRFPFDVVSIGINAADRHHLSFATELLPRATQNQVGVLATEVTADGRLLSSFVPPAGSSLVPGPLTLQEALGYVLTLPLSAAVLDCESVAEVEEAARIAEAFTPLAEADMQSIAERTRAVARQALHFRRWTS